MADRNKGYRGCKPNPMIETLSFPEYVQEFCNHQINSRKVPCKVCGELMLCITATINPRSVHGTFGCEQCGYVVKKSISYSTLEDHFNAYRRGVN